METCAWRTVTAWQDFARPVHTSGLFFLPLKLVLECESRVVIYLAVLAHLKFNDTNFFQRIFSSDC